MQDFEGKTAVITGGASGIGLAMAELFAEQGMQIVLADIEEARLTAAVASLTARGAACIGQVTDVADPAQVNTLAAAAQSAFGGVHIACNNAGVFTGGLLWEESPADYQWLVDVNVTGVMNGIRTFVPMMIEQDCPCHIVNTASMAALTAMPYSGIYHLTKHAVLAVSESLFHELSFHAPQVGVSVLCPEAINTGIAQAERNRPAQYNGKEQVVEHDARTLVMDALADTTAKGIGPEVMARRVLEGIKTGRFYLLSNEEWWQSACVRLEDIREGRNPTFSPPISPSISQ
ncbi:MAG: SDR family NAD(P)-dependent oxidoreductase [Pseudomonadota bacterium]